jgi:hypothetical protein
LTKEWKLDEYNAGPLTAGELRYGDEFIIDHPERITVMDVFHGDHGQYVFVTLRVPIDRVYNEVMRTKDE